MLGVHYIGPRGYPEGRFRGATWRCEHRVYLGPQTPPEDREVFRAGGQFVAPDPDPFWLFGFGPGQVECIYQGPEPLRDEVLEKIVPALRDAVREELNTGRPQAVDLTGQENDHAPREPHHPHHEG